MKRQIAYESTQQFLKWWIISVWLVLVCGMSAQAADQPMNVILILADDLGWSDLACYGADLHETPHLDRLATDGMRFRQAYAAAPVCTPTRAAIMTGYSPARLHMTIWSEGALKPPANRKLKPADSLPNLPLSQQTLAEVFQEAGYLTALIGKWHLGDADHAPETQGFDINIGGTHWGAPETFFWPYRGQGRFTEYRYVPHLDFGTKGEYLTDRLTNEALRVIDHAATHKKPFFLYLAHHAPHTPIEAPSEDVADFEKKLKPNLHHQHPVYAAMIRRLDESVGRVRAKLQQHQLDKNTVVIFTSDNGGYLGTADYRGKAVPITSNWPLRSGKSSLYEGGLRVPLIIDWPGLTTADSLSDQPVVLTDLFPTLIHAIASPTKTSQTKASPNAAMSGDGEDLRSLLRDPMARLKRTELMFHYPHYYHIPATTPCGAIRSGNWKLIETFEDNRVELYDLSQDPSEERDLAKSNTTLADALRRRLAEWRTSVGAAMPRP